MLRPFSRKYDPYVRVAHSLFLLRCPSPVSGARARIIRGNFYSRARLFEVPGVLRKSRLHANTESAPRFCHTRTNNRNTDAITSEEGWGGRRKRGGQGAAALKPVIIPALRSFAAMEKKKNEIFMANSNAASLSSPLTCERTDLMPVFYMFGSLVRYLVVTGLDYDAAPSHLHGERGTLIASNSSLNIPALAAGWNTFKDRAFKRASRRNDEMRNLRHDTFSRVKSGFGEFTSEHTVSTLVKCARARASAFSLFQYAYYIMNSLGIFTFAGYRRGRRDDPPCEALRIWSRLNLYKIRTRHARPNDILMQIVDRLT